MERFCGALAHANKSPQHLWASLHRHVLQIAQLAQIKLIYGLTDKLSLEEARHNIATGTRYDGYNDLVFVRPMRTTILHSSIRKKVAAYASTALGVPFGVMYDTMCVRGFVIWGRMQQVENGMGGDLVRGHALSPGLAGRSRDASYVKVSVRYTTQ